MDDTGLARITFTGIDGKPPIPIQNGYGATIETFKSMLKRWRELNPKLAEHFHGELIVTHYVD